MKVTRNAPPRAHHRVLAPAATLFMVTMLAACSGTDVGPTSAEQGSPDSAGVAQRDSAGLDARGQAAPDTDAAERPSTANRTTVRTRAMIRTGTVRIEARDLDAARTTIDGLLERYGGFLDEEETNNDARGRSVSSRLVLRVPEPEFGTVMSALKKVARTKGSSRDSENVTSEVIDVDSRVATAEASLVRLRKFLRQASDVDDMIRIESEIAEREAELESMKAQQSYLADQTTMSTITVQLSAPPVRAAPPEKTDDAGFLAGLSSGWNALKTFLVGLATILGAVLPFLVVLAVVGVPVWLLVRAVTSRRVSGRSARARSR